ncbi:MAG: polysaccharide biosynthesis/export family protein [Gammaproteobacteria bacterium]
MLRHTLTSFFSAAVALALAGSALAATADPLGVNQALNPRADSEATAPAKAAATRQKSTTDASEAAPRNQPPQYYDYSANLQSDVFGANLFTGSFAREGATQFNPDYAVAVGDKIHVRLWGAFDFDAPLTVDPQGNIFLPHAGPVQVRGVRNQELQRLVEAAVAKVFRSNVSSYASLAAAQPVRVFVSGFVNRPGLYSGTSMDSLLHYLDQAGGIDPERGSFLNVQVKRGPEVRATANLYDFLLNGTMPLIQLSDGDVIFVAPRQSTVKVSGLAENAKRFEFTDSARTVADLITVAKPQASATHVRIIRNTGALRNIEYYPLADAARVALQNGDDLAFTADKKPGTITVRVEGEHESAQEYVLPYGARMGDLLQQIQYSERSDKDSLQLFRISVKERQKQMLQTSLKSLEAAALTARSGTSDEARLRREEADLILQWVERAKKIEPNGQVFIAQADKKHLLLENGDILRVPTKDGLVLVSGEVLFPNAIAYDKSLSLDDYIQRAGGYTQNAEAARLVVAHRDGSFTEAGGKKGFFSSDNGDVVVRAGDEILVLPKIDVKSRQIWKDMTQIIYQIAVSAAVVLGI